MPWKLKNGEFLPRHLIIEITTQGIAWHVGQHF